MPRSGRHGWLRLVGLGFALVGCSQSSPPAFPEWVPKQAEFAPSPSSADAFDGYVLAAREAESAAGNLVNFVSFDGRNKRELISRLRKALSLVRQASGKSCNFHFVSRPPFELDPNQTGWRLIRLSLTWQIEAAAKNGDLSTAVNLTCLETKVGFDLTGGGARDADIGLQMVDDARKALLGHLSDLGAQQLAQLTSGLKRGLAAKPEFSQVAENEQISMLHAVQFVQDAYRKRDYTAIESNLRGEVRDAVTFLRQLENNDRTKRPAYFEGFAKEAGSYVDWAKQQSALPLVKRSKPDDKEKGMRLATERPWRRLSKQFFTTLEPIVERMDVTVARTRLLILTSEILRQVKTVKQAPKTLGGFSRDLILDPFSGLPFMYSATGTEFKLYSVGDNFQDDQGNTDSVGRAPDLTLEPVQR